MSPETELIIMLGLWSVTAINTYSIVRYLVSTRTLRRLQKNVFINN